MTIHAPTRPTRSTGWVPVALVVLSLIPAVSGTLRLLEVFGGPHLMPENPRIAASPAPVVVHILSVIPYAVLGAFQFSARLRRRRPGWHRVTGRVLVGLGLAVAFSGLWMTLFYPRQTGTGELAYVFRLSVGSAMAASIIIGLAAVRRGDVAHHLAWMTRAYALALGGYKSGAAQTADAVFGIQVAAGALPAVMTLLAVLVMAKYELTDTMHARILADITARRESGDAPKTSGAAVGPLTAPAN